MSQKKMIGRSAAIALGIACIVLVAGLGGATAYYTMIINNMNAKYNDEVNTYNNYVNDHHHTDEDYDSLTSQNTNLKNDISSLSSDLNLQESQIIVSNKTVNQGPGQLSAVVSLSFPYAGYLVITSTSDTTKAYVSVQYWFQGTLYTSQYNVGTSGNVTTAVLKSDSATIYVGNTNPVNGATSTISITYYF
jgi:hypothetical protein